MTAIAAFQVEDEPFLISDVLLTSNRTGPPPAPIPVVGDYDWASVDFGVTGLASKIIVTPDGRLAMCWAGEVATIAQAIESLNALRRSPGIDVGSMRRFLAQCGELGVAAVGWLHDGQEFHLLEQGTTDYSQDVFTLFRAAGSGAKLLGGAIRGRTATRSSAPFYKAVEVWSMLWSWDYYGEAEHIQKAAAGGGYELVRWDGRRGFVKTGGVSFGAIRIADDGVRLDSRLTNVDYVRLPDRRSDSLVIRVGLLTSDREFEVIRVPGRTHGFSFKGAGRAAWLIPGLLDGDLGADRDFVLQQLETMPSTINSFIIRGTRANPVIGISPTPLASAAEEAMVRYSGDQILFSPKFFELLDGL